MGSGWWQRRVEVVANVWFRRFAIRVVRIRSDSCFKISSCLSVHLGRNEK